MASSRPRKRSRTELAEENRPSNTASPSKSTTVPGKQSPVVVFAHGTSAPSSSDWMIRVSCMVAAREDITASVIICLGYPLKGMNGAVRDETLLQLTVPVMFVQGSKDALCPLKKLEAIRNNLKVVNELHVVDGGDHSFKISKKHLQATGSI